MQPHSRGAAAPEVCGRRHHDEGRGRAAWRKVGDWSRWLAIHRASPYGAPTIGDLLASGPFCAPHVVAGLDPATHHLHEGDDYTAGYQWMAARAEPAHDVVDTLSFVIPGRATWSGLRPARCQAPREPGVHNHRACGGVRTPIRKTETLQGCVRRSIQPGSDRVAGAIAAIYLRCSMSVSRVITLRDGLAKRSVLHDDA
jgi:hypothetical protein